MPGNVAENTKDHIDKEVLANAKADEHSQRWYQDTEQYNKELKAMVSPWAPC